MGSQALVNPQIFPHVVEFFTIQEGAEPFLVMYPPIHVLIPGSVCVGGDSGFGGLGMRHPDSCEPPDVTHLFCNSLSRKGQNHSW